MFEHNRTSDCYRAAPIVTGVLRAAQGQLEEAVSLLRQGVAAAPGAAHAYCNLGAALHESSRHLEAIEQFEHALALKPDYAIALNNLGVTLAAIGRTEDAIQKYHDALAIKSDYPECLNNLGVALHKAKRERQALEKFEQSLRLKPDYLAAMINLAHSNKAIGELAKAIALYQSLIKISPQNALLHLYIGQTYHSDRKNHQALKHYDEACQLISNFSEADACAAFVLMENGELDKAQLRLERAIQNSPNEPRYYRALAMCTTMSSESPYLKQLLALNDQIAHYSDTDKIHLHSALGKTLSDTEHYEAAFSHIQAGNILLRRQVLYNETDELGRFARISEIFTADFLRFKYHYGIRSSMPIFIVGMPRSGSTLVEQILASHPDVMGGGEIDNFEQSIHRCGLRDQDSGFPDEALSWSPEQIYALGSQYQQSIEPLAFAERRLHKVQRFTNKKLDNFRYIGLIHLAMPNARIVHIHRDPISTCLSCYSLLLRGMNFSHDLGEIGRYYRSYQKLMRHWHSVLPRGVMLDIRYEDLIDDTETQAREIVAHCGLSWHPGCLRFYETTRVVRTASVAQVRRPIYAGSMNRWRPDTAILEPLVAALRGDSDCSS